MGGRVKVDMEVEVLTRRAELAALREAWSELWERCAAVTTFQRPEWLLPWCEELGPEEILAIACRSEGRLVGLAPLFIHRAAEGRVVRLLGTGITDYNDLLAAPGREAAVVEALLACLRDRAGTWDLLDFEQLLPTSPLLAAGAPAGFQDDVEKQEACPARELQDGAGLDQALPAALRKPLGRARRKLSRLGAVRIELADEEHLDEHLDALFEIHRARWNERGSEGVLARGLYRFHSAVARGMLARGALRLFALRVGPRIIAANYAFADRGAVACYLTGFDPAFARYSPGQQLLGEVIAHAASNGARIVDFLRGREAYKYEWGVVDRWTYRRRLRLASA